MSLFSLGQRLFGNARELFNDLQTPVDGQEQQQPRALQKFGVFGLSGNNSNITGANESLLNVSNHIAASNAGNNNVATAARTQGVEWREGATKDGGYISAVSVYDLGQAKWSSAVDPKAVSLIAYARGAMNAGVTNDPEIAKQIAEQRANGITLHLPNGKTRPVTSKDFGDRDFMKTYTDPQGRFVMFLSKNELAEARKLAQELKGNQSQPQTQAGAVAGTTLAVPQAQPLQFDWSKINIRAAATTLSGAAKLAPLAPAAVGLAGQGAVIRQRYEIERQKWEARQKTQVLPPALTIQNADKKPETKTAEKPQPKVQPIPEAKDLPKGEIAVRPKAQPTTSEPVAPTSNQPAQPNAPGSPNAPKPPRINPKDITGPVTAATTATIGKAAADAVNKTNNLNIEKVRYGSTELSLEAIQFRKDNKIFGGQNTAVFKYVDKDGMIKTKVMESDSKTNKHSEQRLDKWLQEQGLERSAVIEIYTELEPCVYPMPNKCKEFLQKAYPDAKITYSYEYGVTKESRQKGVDERRNDLKEILNAKPSN